MRGVEWAVGDKEEDTTVTKRFSQTNAPPPPHFAHFLGGPSFFFSLSLPPLFSGYFSQFGAITRLRVSRNKKTAKARSYAFLEFGSPDVAAIAAEAMDG